jgi:hypothetical protein
MLRLVYPANTILSISLSSPSSPGIALKPAPILLITVTSTPPEDQDCEIPKSESESPSKNLGDTYGRLAGLHSGLWSVPVRPESCLLLWTRLLSIWNGAPGVGVGRLTSIP